MMLIHCHVNLRSVVVAIVVSCDSIENDECINK